MSAQRIRPSFGQPATRPDAAPTLSVVVPLYRSERTIAPLVERLLEILRPHHPRLQIVLVNDGSPDDTHARVVELARRFPQHVVYVRLARNFGEHNAVMCGLNHATGDAVAIIDDDFQNPPEEIVRLVERLQEGYDVVYGRYVTKRHTWFRNLGSRFANRVASHLLPKPTGLYLSSFKAMNAFTAREVTRYEGPYPYLDGLILRATSSIASIDVRHEPRTQGRSNYNLRLLVRLWLNMFTGFSVIPLRLASILGLTMAGLGTLLALFFVASRLLGGIFIEQEIPPGWASLIVMVVIFGGIQLSVLGILGEYVGRIFLTQNRQPQFVIRELVEFRETGSSA